MTGLKVIGMHAAVLLAAVAVYFGAGYAFGYAAGTDAALLEPWALAWAGSTSIALAVTLATFAVDIAEHIAVFWAPTPRGRHAR